MYYFPLNLFIILLVVLLAFIGSLIFVKQTQRRLAISLIITLLSGILGSVLFVNMVGDYYSGTYVIFENTFVFFVLLAVMLIFAGMTAMLAYNTYGGPGGVLDNRRYGL